MRTRSSRSTEDLVELDITTGRKRVQRSQRVQEEPEVLVADTMDVPEGNGNPLGNGLGRARQTRPIGQGDAPNRHQQRQGIVPPPVQNHNFEIKLGMINLVQNKMFHGLPSEDPIDHLDEFDRLCDLTKINGVSEDAIKLRLFPMSLADKAHQWEKSLPHGTITTWDECKKAFLAKFFSTGRTAKLRGEISSFIQRNNETFAEAWERYREMLDTASNGNFLNQDVDDGWQLVENIANSNGSYGEEYDRTNRSSTHHSIESDEKLRKDVKALNEKLDKLILAQSTMKKVNFVSAEEMEPVQEGEDTQFAEVCYMSNGQGGYNKGYYNYKSNPAMSYRNTDVANPQDQVYPQQQAARSSQVPQHGYGQKNNYQGPQGTFPGQQMNIPPGFPHQPPQPAPSQENELKAMLKQLLQGQADGVVDTSKKLAEINSKIENLNTRVYSLENHASSVAAATKQGQLPGKAIQNPKEQCKVIFTQEGLVEEEDQERVIEDFCLLLNDEEIVAAEAPGVQIDQPEVHAPTVAIHTSPVELARQARSAARSSPTLARSSPTSSVRQPVLLDPYQPVAASSSRLLSQGHKEVIHKFRRDLSGIGIELPPMDSMSEAFDQMQMVKDVSANSDKVSEVLQESTHQFNLLTSPTFLPKVKDQGKFTLPCTLGHLEIDNALVDSGASINLISLSMAEKLGIAGALQRPTTSIMFGDATSKSPLGVFKNYHLKIGECIIQTDLTVMEMEEEKDLPCYWEPLSLPRGSDFCATIDSTNLSSKSHGATKVVKERVDKEPRVGKDKDERGPRIEKPRLERARVEKPRSDRPRAERLVQAPCVLDEESLQALFDEPLGRALQEGEDAASKARPGDKRKDPPAQAPSVKPSQLTMTLFPTKFENGKIEYKIRYKGRSRPFSRAKALVTSEQSRDPTKLKELLSQVLTITLDGTLVKKQVKMTNSEGSRASQRRMVEGESSNAREKGLRCKPIWKRMDQRMEDLMQRICTLRTV
ncbi:unnamed protein product [Microthlaspi erraticum]|uniref:Retrotransposon gag domain-containing protein n=1 Tax=Microthlaspi erraticum TaxID=1685480 RepID=A0A6D2ILZ3_9BRAS|nr:unnamed protein product [Microthlaspi erraticum]